MTIAPRRPPLQVRGLDDAAEAVRQAGGRLTEPRKAVVQALLAAGAPVSADQIADGLDGRLPRIDPASVYRNLEWLEQIGLVRHVHLGHGPGLYALASQPEPEYLVCESCGRITSIASTELDRARHEIERAAGYRAHFDHFPIHGLCGDCAEP